MLAFTTAVHLFEYCATDSSTCMTAAVSFGIDVSGTLPVASVETAVTTAGFDADTPSMMAFLTQLLQLTSIYLILIAVGILVVLECMELYYLRRLFARSRGVLGVNGGR